MCFSDDILALQHSFLLPGDGDFILHHTQRRNIDADTMLGHHILNRLIVGPADERMEMLRNFKFLIRLLALFEYREENMKGDYIRGRERDKLETLRRSIRPYFPSVLYLFIRCLADLVHCLVNSITGSHYRDLL